MIIMPAPGRAALHLHPGRGLLPLPAHRHGLLPRHRLAQGQRGGEEEHRYCISLHLTASHCISLHLQGAFWSLMYGLLAGVIRMILDFSFPEPLCMEADQRPWLVRAFC